MRKWGILVTAFYALVVILILIPFGGFLTSYELGEPLVDAWPALEWEGGAYWWPVALWIGVLLAGQAMLLFLSVDTSFRRIQQRRHIGVSVATSALMVGLLSGMAIWSLIVAIKGDDSLGGNDSVWVIVFWLTVAIFWLCWGVVFHFYKVGTSDKFDRLVSWLIRGSIMELLIVVPCHVIVRQRGDCSAPVVTGFGISSGIAVMLLAFGPGVLYLYQKRLARYASPSKGATPDARAAP